jgi:lysophospholipase II
VVVAGFSQGGAIALLMLRCKVKLAGIAEVATWLPLEDEPLATPANKDTCVWMAHGTNDEIVSGESVSMMLQTEYDSTL